MNVRISSRAFSSGFDITTPAEALSAALSPFGELLITNAHGTQIARVAGESFLSRAYNIIISGGEFYQFKYDNSLKACWTCSGGGRTLELCEGKSRHYVVGTESRRIAVGTKAWFSGDYSVTLLEVPDFKLVVCMFLALHLSQNRNDSIDGAM